MKPMDQQVHELRHAVVCMAVSLGAALPHTPEVIGALDALADSSNDYYVGRLPEQPRGGDSR